MSSSRENLQNIEISKIVYDADGGIFTNDLNVEDCLSDLPQGKITWLNLDGYSEDIVKRVGNHYGIQPLLQEHIMEQDARARSEVIDNQIFFLLTMLSYVDKNIETEKCSLLLGKGYILTFQEGKEGDEFGEIRDKLTKKVSTPLLRSDETFLFYTILAKIVDGYLSCIDDVAEDLEAIEEKIIQNKVKILPTLFLYEKKRILTTIKKLVRPFAEAVLKIIKHEQGRQVLEGVNFYLRDLIEKSQTVSENVDMNIEKCSGLLDLYFSMLGAKTNEIMKFLTIMSSFFIPLTFIAGLYGKSL